MSTQHNDGGPVVFPWISRESPIEASGLSVRILNAFRRAGMSTIGSTLDLSRDDFICLKNMGEASWNEFRAFKIAFRAQEEHRPSSPHPKVEVNLRDYFAAHAASGVLAGDPGRDFDWDEVAIQAYGVADAMLRAREAK